MFEQLSDRLGAVFKKLRSRGKLHPKQVDGALVDIRDALIDADVAVEVADDLVARVRARALGAPGAGGAGVGGPRAPPPARPPGGPAGTRLAPASGTRT